MVNTNPAAKWSWKNEPELMARLQHVQNSPRNEHIDIMTIVGFFDSRERLEAHVLRYEAYEVA